MISQKQLFLRYVAQTSDAPLMLEIERAEGIYLYDRSGKAYIDLISGISVNNLGHRHPQVIQAIKDQLDQYMHLMVYGEYVQSPQVKLATLLQEHLPAHLNSIYFVNSGTEATEGAMKLAKRYTGRTEIIAFYNAYHGSTQGALSLNSQEYFKNAFRPLLPDIRFVRYNHPEDLQLISTRTAAVIAEPVQGEAGYIAPANGFMQNLQQKCREQGALLILDEIQTGFGRTGKLFALEHDGLSPDIILMAKGMGAGMPIGAFAAPQAIMQSISHDPVLGHITTFGGHPVCCAAAHAGLQALLQEELVQSVAEKEKLFREKLVHPAIRKLNGKGLMLALELDSFEQNKKVIDCCIGKGLITDWFLFAPHCLRIAPPLIIHEEEITLACEIINSSLSEIYSN